VKLFPKDKVVGIFRGFSEGGLEFHADLVLPYRPELQASPMHGQFVVVALESDDEGVLGRITSISAQGRLASGAGEDYSLRAVRDDRPIPEDLREQYLKYQVDIRVLGVLRVVDDKLVYAASHRRLPHVGSKVAFLNDELICEVAGANGEGAELGYLALGEFIYAGADKRLAAEPWMRVVGPMVIPKFPVQQLVSRRTFVFARAGFGKSNLVKLLFSDLYATTPTVPRRSGSQQPVGTVIFDPDGEYFWPDAKNRPGLCDVPDLHDQIVVFTNRAGPSPYYRSFVVGGIKLDIRRLRPADVVAIALAPEKQDQQNVRKLKGLSDTGWQKLVDEIYGNWNAADDQTIAGLLGLTLPQQEAELFAARANMTEIVRMLHDPSSQMLDSLLAALREGKLCVVDVSQMRGTPALVLSGLILNRIFDHNQQEFTKAAPETIPTIAVVEEAQSVLSSTGSSGAAPYVSWVKEGRKYDLGAVLITQQPGSIPQEILSQGDNWFIFHLLSAGDLAAAKRANAHFSDDMLSSLLNEPLPGHGLFWSSSGGRSYPIPIRVLLFEGLYPVADPGYNRGEIETYASKLRARFSARLASVAAAAGPMAARGLGPEETPSEATEQPVDVLGAIQQSAIEAVTADRDLRTRIERSGIPWMGVLKALEAVLPADVDDPNKLAAPLVKQTLDRMFGPGEWHTERRPSRNQPGALTTWVIKGAPESPPTD
jgi:uncharacterized protein